MSDAVRWHMEEIDQPEKQVLGGLGRSFLFIPLSQRAAFFEECTFGISG